MANIAGLILAFILEMLKAPPSRTEDGIEGEERRGTPADRKSLIRPILVFVLFITLVVAGLSELGVGKYLWNSETTQLALLKKDIIQYKKDLAAEKRLTEKLRTDVRVSEGKQDVLEDRITYLEGIILSKDRVILALDRDIAELAERAEDDATELAALLLKVELVKEEKAVLIRKLSRIDEGRKRLWSELSDFGGG